MKIFSLIFLVFFITLTGTAQTKKVAIQVDILGKKHVTVRYYHPVNGVYTITPRKVQIDKATLKDLENFVLIDPASTLHNSVNHIQANSLRHYVDPSELVYVDWKMGHDTSNYLRLDTFTTASQKIRPENYIAEKSLLQKVYHPYDMEDLKAHRKFLKLVKKSYSSKYSSMFGTKREAII
ncbi:MAG: hypothetical protein P8I55_08215 [Crocinitomix sp.]|nr:hypothetical protein [Crocinitomix sp.]